VYHLKIFINIATFKILQTGAKDRHCVFKNSEENRREKSEESDVGHHVLGKSYR
jgi:hypothetical protein